jgi:hypothetical protein
MSDNDYLNPECAEAVRAALANSDACWRMEQEVIVRQRDEARRDLGEILAIIHRDGGHYTGEHGISKSVADAHATWAAMVRERDEARADFDSLEDDAAKVVLAYRNGDKIELDEAVESLASNGRPQWWENVKPIGLRGESDD